MERYVCIHAHFYQPPRENPWLEAIEMQDSAWPYHDWNERIAAECYEPNATARILDEDGRIVDIVNNYKRISFNFGPTLLTWMETKAPVAYQAIIEADAASRRRFSGHGSAIAQAYHHSILPLASSRDRRTEVLWGIRDFVHRFGREPEGMWLPETAVDVETLDILATAGIRFTILSQDQAQRVRKRGAREWTDVRGGRVNPRMPYEVRLPSGRTIAVFFHDGPISKAAAFGDLLSNGENLADRLAGAFQDRDAPELVHMATDGETYGHHKWLGDMALAYAIRKIESEGLARTTNYGEFLERLPPTHEAEVRENTSWSCAHGIERWRADCGCNTGSHPAWNQSWRTPLRGALDRLRDTLAGRFQEQGAQVFKDAWAARDDYIGVVLERSPERVASFLDRHAWDGVPRDPVRMLRLLEMQRHAMMMFTSCGWFFDDLSGIETVQVLQYAGRAIQLAEALGADGVEARFLEHLGKARSNLPEHGDGRAIYENRVRPARIDLPKVVAHHAIGSLFENRAPDERVYCYAIRTGDFCLKSLGTARLAVGHLAVSSDVTGESGRYAFGFVHLGDHNVSGGVREFGGDEAYRAMVERLFEPFDRADVPETIRAIDRVFGHELYSLRQMFRDEQRRILDRITSARVSEAESLLRRVYETHAPLMRFLHQVSIPEPAPFRSAAQTALNAALRQAIEADDIDPAAIHSLLAEASSAGVDIDRQGLGFALNRAIERRFAALASNGDDMGALDRLDAAVALARDLPFEASFRRVQNGYWHLAQTLRRRMKRRQADGDAAAEAWVTRFDALGGRLGMKVG